MPKYVINIGHFTDGDRLQFLLTTCGKQKNTDNTRSHRLTVRELHFLVKYFGLNTQAKMPLKRRTS